VREVARRELVAALGPAWATDVGDRAQELELLTGAVLGALAEVFWRRTLRGGAGEVVGAKPDAQITAATAVAAGGGDLLRLLPWLILSLTRLCARRATRASGRAADPPKSNLGHS